MDEQSEASRLDAIEKGIKAVVDKGFPAQNVRPKAPILPRDTVRLRCESIILMAFQTWMQEMRGPAPFCGPVDLWKFNEMKALLFSIGENNGEFDKGEKA